MRDTNHSNLCKRSHTIARAQSSRPRLSRKPDPFLHPSRPEAPRPLHCLEYALSAASSCCTMMDQPSFCCTAPGPRTTQTGPLSDPARPHKERHRETVARGERGWRATQRATGGRARTVALALLVGGLEDRARGPQHRRCVQHVPAAYGTARGARAPNSCSCQPRPIAGEVAEITGHQRPANWAVITEESPGAKPC